MSAVVHQQVSHPDLLTIDEVANLLRCSVKKIRRRVEGGDIPAFRLADRGPWLFRRDDVLRQLTPVPVASSSSFPTGSGPCTPPTAVDWVTGLTGATSQKA